MAKNDNLTDYLDDLAEAIKAQTGDSNDLNAQDFSTAIQSIVGGTGGNASITLLKCVSSEAPQNAVIGDKYYNLSTKKIYQATGSNTWNNGSTPLETAIYVAKDNASIWSWYDGDMHRIGDYGTYELENLVYTNTDNITIEFEVVNSENSPINLINLDCSFAIRSSLDTTADCLVEYGRSDINFTVSNNKVTVVIPQSVISNVTGYFIYQFTLSEPDGSFSKTYQGNLMLNENLQSN